MDRPVEITDRRGKASRTFYDSLGRVASWRDANGRQIQMIDGAGKVWQTGYDAEGRKVTSTTPLGRTIRFERDAVGKITKVIDPLGNEVTLTWDSMSRQTSATDPLGRRVDITYDAAGLVAAFTQGGLGTASYAYGTLGFIQALRDFRGKTWSFDHTQLGRLAKQKDPLGNEVTYQYDQRGRLVRINYPTGEWQTAEYDSEERIVRAVYSDGREIRFTYDAMGRKLTAGGISFTYDPEGNVKDTGDGDLHFGASYDDGGRLKTVTYANGLFTVTYEYDARDLLSRVTDNLTGAALEFTYDDDARPLTIGRSNGVTTTFNWDAGDRITRIQDGAIADQKYLYNGAGDVTQVTQTLPLDPASLLSPRTDSFTYDDASQINSTGYVHDARGRLTTMRGSSLVWDASGNLRQTGDATLEYNGLGNLSRRTQGGATVHHYYNAAITSNPIVAEWDEASQKSIRYYVWSPEGSLLYMIDALSGNKVYFYHFDVKGSTLFLTDRTGVVTDTYAYTPYGSIAGRTGSNSQPFTFTGQSGVRQEGGGGLYHIRSRYYDAVTGRFISRDPAWPNYSSWDGLNPYLYARDNPASQVDVTGKGPIAKAAASLLKEAFKKGALKRLGWAALRKGGSNVAQEVIIQGVRPAPDLYMTELEEKMAEPFWDKCTEEFAPYMKGIDWKELGEELLKPTNWISPDLVALPIVAFGFLIDKDLLEAAAEVANIMADSDKTLDQKILLIRIIEEEEHYEEGLLDAKWPFRWLSDPSEFKKKSIYLLKWRLAQKALGVLTDIKRMRRTIELAICEAETAGVKTIDGLMKIAAEWNFDELTREMLIKTWTAKHGSE
jgi:RHS repeat-associated protein